MKLTCLGYWGRNGEGGVLSQAKYDVNNVIW